MQLYQLNNNLTTQLILDHATLSTQQQLDNLKHHETSWYANACGTNQQYNEHNRLLNVWAQRLPGLKPPTLMSTKAAGPKAPNFNEYAMNSNFQQLRQQHEQLIRLIIMDNFLQLTT
jgi:hypothetical protein